MAGVTRCGGPPADQGLVALRFNPEACPTELRIESYRTQIRAGVEDIRPRYRDDAGCDGSCTGATVRHVLTR